MNTLAWLDIAASGITGGQDDELGTPEVEPGQLQRGDQSGFESEGGPFRMPGVDRRNSRSLVASEPRKS
jgi:hypothetical protein